MHTQVRYRCLMLYYDLFAASALDCMCVLTRFYRYTSYDGPPQMGRSLSSIPVVIMPI